MNQLIKIALILLAGATVSRMVRRKQYIDKNHASPDGISVSIDSKEFARCLGNSVRKGINRASVSHQQRIV